MVYKNNFWNQLRKERGLSFSTIAKILNCSNTAVRYYFMGYRMPSTDIVQKLCEGFNVEFETGMQEFRNMYKAYKAGHSQETAPKKVKTATGNGLYGKTNAFKADPNNFWKCTLQTSGKTFRDVAKDTGLGYSSIQMYFRGFVMPSEGVVKRLCDYFSVDYSEGLAEFKAIYRAWGEANPEFEAFRNTYRRKSEGSKSPRRATVQGALTDVAAKLSEPATVDIEQPVIEVENSYVVYAITEQADEILKQLYNKLSYAEFKNVASQLSKVAAYSGSVKDTSLLESIYNVVDCPTFVHIVRVLDQEVAF